MDDSSSQTATIPTSPYAPAPKVQEAAQQKYALENGGQLPMQGNGVTTPIVTYPPQNFFNGNKVIGRYENPANLQPKQSGSSPTVDFTNMPSTPQFTPNGYGNANPTTGPTQLPYMKDAADTTPQNVTNFERMPVGNNNQWNPVTDTSDVGYKGAPYDPSQYDSLSEALNGGISQQAPEFKADTSKRDGGFFGWLKGLAPKLRPGRREGESDEDYDRRITTNRERLAVLADAMRHMGNIYNTSRYAPLQTFNNPVSEMEQAYQTRSAQRQAKAKMEADAAQKQAEMTLKQQAAEADRKYKEWLMGMKNDAAQLGKDKFEYQKDKDKAAADAKAAKDERDFKYKQGRDKVKDEQTERRLGIAQYNATHKGSGRSGKGGSGSGGKYWFEDKNGKIKYQPNKTMWEQEYYREYGKLPDGETSVSTSTKTIDYKTGQETTTTTRKKGASVTSQAAASQNAAKAARNAKGKSSSSKPKSKNGYKNTKALGL